MIADSDETTSNSLVTRQSSFILFAFYCAATKRKPKTNFYCHYSCGALKSRLPTKLEFMEIYDAAVDTSLGNEKLQPHTAANKEKNQKKLRNLLWKNC